MPCNEPTSQGHVAELTTRPHRTQKNASQTSIGYKQSNIDTELQMQNSMSYKCGQIIKQRLLCASGFGAWLTVMPNKLHGTISNAEEFRDNI